MLRPARRASRRRSMMPSTSRALRQRAAVSTLSAPTTPMRSPTATLSVGCWRPRPTSSTVASSSGSPGGNLGHDVAFVFQSAGARRARLHAACEAAAPRRGRSITRSAGASSARWQRLGQRAGCVLAHANQQWNERLRIWRDAAPVQQRLGRRPCPARLRRWRRASLRPARSRRRPRTTSTTGNAPASVKALASP